MPILGRDPPRQDPWALTSWSTVARLSSDTRQVAEVAWRDLIARYRGPLLSQARRLLARGRGRPATAEDAEEAVQAFWVACLEKDWLGRADAERGRFRAFVQVLLKRFVRDRVEHEHASVRHPGKGRSVVEMGALGVEEAAVASDRAEAEAFDREWVKVAIDRAVAAVEGASARDGVVLRDLMRTEGAGSPDLAALIRVHAEQLPVIKSRVRDRFSKRFAEELSATVRDPADFDEEWQALARYLP